MEKCQDPHQANATWWPGRLWQHGRFATEERCAQGLCDMNQAYTPEQCDTGQFCSGGVCASCLSSKDNPVKFACTTNEVQASCQGYDPTKQAPFCITFNKYIYCRAWDATLQECLYASITEKAHCSQLGICAEYPQANFCGSLTTASSPPPPPKFKFTSCEELTARECNRCVYNVSTCPIHQSLFKCQLKLTDCENQAQCTNSGACSDEILHFSYASNFPGILFLQNLGGSVFFGKEIGRKKKSNS